MLTGVFGVGKSTVAAEIADLLEGVGVPYAAIDLDWLTWCNVGSPDLRNGDAVLPRNLASVMGNYADAGVRYFVLALSVRDQDQLDILADTVAMPLYVVELVVSLDEIKGRLGTDPTTGRRDDLAETIAWIEQGHGTGFADHVVDNTRPVRVVATDILQRLAWPS